MKFSDTPITSLWSQCRIMAVTICFPYTNCSYVSEMLWLLFINVIQKFGLLFLYIYLSSKKIYIGYNKNMTFKVGELLNIEQILQKYFGFEDFRTNQRQII